MSTHPFIPLYVDDYDAATAHLTPAQDGIYGRLMRLCWRTPGCSLPTDEAWIARKVRLSGAEWERIGKPVLEEFFTPYRGRLIQKRLKREYDDISRKKSARAAAGKMGGVAKARKGQGNSASNATVLPADTRAFPEPYPEPEGRPPKPPEGASLDFVEKHFEEAWTAYPEEGRATSNLGKSRSAWISALPDAGGAEPLLRAVYAYVTLQQAAGAKAKPAPAFHRWLADRRFQAFEGALRGRQAPAWDGPPEIWELVAAPPRNEAFARSWLAGVRWQEKPIRALVSASPTTIRKLREEVGADLDERGIQLLAGAA